MINVIKTRNNLTNRQIYHHNQYISASGTSTNKP